MKKSKKKEMTVILLTHNRLDCLQRTMAAWEKNGLKKHIIVDNGSKDGTQEWLRKSPYQSLLLKENVGISLAQQIAYDRINDGWIIITGDDIEPVSPEVLKRFEELQCLGGDFCVGAGVNISKGYYPQVLGSHKTKYGEIELTSHVSGMMMMSKKAADSLLHIEKDMIRYAVWRQMGGKVGYAKWIQTFHFDSGITKRGYEYIF